MRILMMLLRRSSAAPGEQWVLMLRETIRSPILVLCFVKALPPVPIMNFITSWESFTKIVIGPPKVRHALMSVSLKITTHLASLFRHANARACLFAFLVGNPGAHVLSYPGAFVSLGVSSRLVCPSRELARGISESAPARHCGPAGCYRDFKWLRGGSRGGRRLCGLDSVRIFALLPYTLTRAHTWQLIRRI